MRLPIRLFLALLLTTALANPALPAPPAATPLPGHASGATAPEEPPAPPKPPAAPAPPAAPRAAETPRPPRTHERTQLFQVAMVVGTTSATADLDGDGQPDPASGTGLDSLPRSVRQALVDLGEFIPYKRYMLLDTVLIRTARDGIATMKGPGGREFRVELKLFPSGGEGDPELIVHRFEVIDMTRTPVRRTEVGGPGGFKQSEEVAPSTPKTIIATSFGMSIGETLVVGSSRLNGGDTALILLVTAPR